jgi:transposase
MGLNVLDSGFLDPDSKIQHKYEMLRAHEVGGLTIKQAAEAFEYSPSLFKKVKNAFEKEGIQGLMPNKRGPKSRRDATVKATDQVIANREQGLNIYENSEDLKKSGFDISPATVHRVLVDHGYVKKNAGERAAVNGSSTR